MSAGLRRGVVQGDVPARPRLAEHVAARRHLVGAQRHVVLHDLERGGRVVVGEREWALLSVADGTRDMEGIVVAARRRGARASVEHLRAFFAQLYAAGLVADGAAEDALAERADADDHSATDAGVAAGRAPEGDATDARVPEGDATEGGRDASGAAARPVRALPGFRLRCDGSGSCCRLYPSVVFTPPEVARARALLPLLEDAAMDPDRLFTPERGADAGVPRTWVVAQRDGRCCYLDEAERCRIHAAGGALAKPLGCRTYPARFVDDGEEVRVAPLVECACVLSSACDDRGHDQVEGEALVAASATRRADLGDGVWVESLPEVIAVGGGRTTSRAAWCSWAREAQRRVGEDVPAGLWALAAELDGGAAGLDASVVAPWALALARRAEARAREDGSWRSPHDLAHLGVGWVARGSALLAEAAAAGGPLPAGDARGRRAEAFQARVLLFGHHLPGHRDVATALRDRAVRMLVARAMATLPLRPTEASVDAAASRVQVDAAASRVQVDAEASRVRVDAEASRVQVDAAASRVQVDADASLVHIERWPLALMEAVLRAHGLAAYVADSANCP